MSKRIFGVLHALLIVVAIAAVSHLWFSHQASLRAILALQAQTNAQWTSLQQQTSANQHLLQQLVNHFQPAMTGATGTGSADGGMPMAGDYTDGMMMGEGSMGSSIMPGMDYDPSASAATPAVPEGAATLSLVLTMEKTDGAPAAGCYVGLLDDAQKSVSLWLEGNRSGTGAAIPGVGSGGFDSSFDGYGGQAALQTASDANAQTLIPEAQGRITAGRVDPGRYTAIIEFPNGWYAHHKIVVRPKEKHVEKLVCPKPTEKAFVTITAPPLPEELRAAGVRLIASVQQPVAKLNGVAWRLLGADEKRVAFDPTTGLTTAILVSQRKDSVQRYGSEPYGSEPLYKFTTEAAEDRFLVLPAGDYKVALSLYRVDPGPKEDFDLWGALEKTRADLHLASDPSSEEAPTFVVQSGQNAWQLVLSEDILNSARERAAKLEQPSPE